MQQYSDLRNCLLFMSFLLLVGWSVAQSDVSLEKRTYQIPLKHVNDPRNLEADFNVMLKNIEAPRPDGPGAKSYLLQQKIKSRDYYKDKIDKRNTVIPSKSTPGPEIGLTFIPQRELPNGNVIINQAGIPSDNTLAINNDDLALVAMNSSMYAHHLVGDSAYFEESVVFLRPFVGGGGFSFYYDPKLFYDPVEDRFILALLKDFDPENSEVIICFSSSSDPADPWYIYHLPGNPLDNNRWTDFPCIAVTEDKLYFTANLIIPDVSWQVGFDGSIIWEMDKKAGFNGASDIQASLYSDIRYDGKFIRNLHPIQGADGLADEMFFLSNRNFDVINDTLFMARIVNDDVVVNPVILDTPYGVPPNARQFDTDTSNVESGLQTNDARVLGGILFDDEIQFVANTINPETGFSAIYHGHILFPYDVPEAYGQIIGDSIKDFGYPNIAWSANELCDRETIIGFNYSSFDHFPGTAAIHYGNDGNYSAVKTISEGLNYVDRLPTSTERWGDYFGIQRIYNQEGTVGSFGYWPTETKGNSGFYATLYSPDTAQLQVEVTIQKSAPCDWEIQLAVINAEQPIQFDWNANNEFVTNAAFGPVCAGDTVNVVVMDERGCEKNLRIIVPLTDLSEGINVYPNPVVDFVAVQFELKDDQVIKAELYDMAGNKIEKLIQMKAKKGLNEFSFSAISLAQGVYNLVISTEKEIIDSFKIVKQ